MKTIHYFVVLGLLFIVACNNEPAPTTEPAAETTPATPAPAEFADAKYAAIGKQGVADLAAGNVDGWMNSFADNAVYVWNSGDSLAGKPAITDYWKKRRGEAIESMSFSNEIYLPVKVNQPQSVEQSGIWVLCWYQVTAKYKATGKSMSQWIHTDLHFDANDKIDRVIQYVDRVPINAASTK